MENKIKDRVRNVMAAVFEIPMDQIDDQSSMDSIESWDSIRHMNLVIALEEEFGCYFLDSETVELLNFKLVMKILNDHGIS